MNPADMNPGNAKIAYALVVAAVAVWARYGWPKDRR